MQFGACIEIGWALLVSLSRYQAFSFMEIDVCFIESYEFADAHARGCKQVDDGKVSFGFAGVSQGFQLFVA